MGTGWRHELLTFCKAQLTAQAASLVDFVMSLFLAEVCNLWYVIATFLGALSGGITNCITNYKWVFENDGLKKRNVAYKYFMVWTGSILLNTGGTYLITEVSGQYFIFAKLIVSVIVGLLWNYQLQRLFVYKDTHIIMKLKRKRTGN
ncbi:MAG: GtrA family protein [Prevotella sp.]|nr:GtrA family protein [Prevotella sp.]